MLYAIAQSIDYCAKIAIKNMIKKYRRKQNNASQEDVEKGQEKTNEGKEKEKEETEIEVMDMSGIKKMVKRIVQGPASRLAQVLYPIMREILLLSGCHRCRAMIESGSNLGYGIHSWWKDGEK